MSSTRFGLAEPPLVLRSFAPQNHTNSLSTPKTIYTEDVTEPTALAAENLFLRKQLALLREREKKAMPTTPADRFVFQAGSLVRLAECIDDRQTGHFDRLASQRIPPLLALEIQTGREATGNCRSQGLDSASSG